MKDARVAFASTGSEANDFLMKFMRFRNAYLGQPKRTKVIARTGSYHGGTMATAALGGFPGTAAAFNLPMDDVLTVGQPDFVNRALEGESEAEFTARMLLEVEQTIEQAGPETVGAMILDPVSYSAGCALPPAGYLTGLQEILARYGVLFFDDEVITGFRLGVGGATERYGVRPDVWCFGKVIGGGLPIQLLRAIAASAL